MRSEPGADDTVRLAPLPALAQPAPVPLQARGVWQWLAAGAAAAMLAMGIAGWLIWPRQAPAPLPVSSTQSPVASPPAPQIATPAQPAQRSLPAVPMAPAPQAVAPTEPAPQATLPSPAVSGLASYSIETADESEIRAHVATGLSVFRFAANPSIVVLDFGSLRQQGLMLNRIAALVEKGAMPRDRVLNDTELDAAISAGGDTIETFYYGHDYSAASIARFFSLAARDGIQLNPEEEKLRHLVALLGWFSPDVHAGLISVPRVGANAEMNAAARQAILRHELSHGEYFSNPNYATYVHQFWLHELTQGERDGVHKFLASEEYDSKIEDLVENEMQAYLMFTRDPVFFTPAKIGITSERLADLQVDFYRHMPRGWLRDLLGQTLPVAAAPY